MTKQTRDKHGRTQHTLPTREITFQTRCGTTKITPIDGSYLKGALAIMDANIRAQVVQFLSEKEAVHA